jgi:hypothetical protein
MAAEVASRGIATGGNRPSVVAADRGICTQNGREDPTRRAFDRYRRNSTAIAKHAAASNIGLATTIV